MSATRTIDDIQAPAAGIWAIDPTHTTVEFIGRHLVFTKVRGRFTGVSGAVTVADDPERLVGRDHARRDVDHDWHARS